MKAFILAAGYGKRLRPLTDSTPKPLLKVGGKPLIQYHLENLAKAGVTQLVINAHWLKAQLFEFLGDGEKWGVQIQWSVEDVLLETGGGMLNALPLLGSDPFLLVNGDVFLEHDFRHMVEISLENNLAHLLLVPNPPHHPGGDFSFCSSAQPTQQKQTGQKARIERKHKDNDWTYAGVSLIHPQLLADYASQEGAFPLLSPLLSAADKGVLSGEVYTGLWEDVGTIERLQALDQKITCSNREEQI